MLTSHRTYNPPDGEDRIYLKQYDEGFQASIRGDADDNPYDVDAERYSKVIQLRHWFWDAGYDEGA